MNSKLILLRHPPVDPAWRTKCYGLTDVPLPEDWEYPMLPDGFEPSLVYTSGLQRCDKVADLLAILALAYFHVDWSLRERDFGTWEGREWDDIYAETGDAMMGMVTHPETWRPPGGETTFELRDRVLWWYDGLSRNEGDILAVTHGGPIAALVGTLNDVPVSEWPKRIPRPGEWVEVPLISRRV